MSSTSTSTDLGAFSKQYAARDLPGQLKMKYRDVGQAQVSEVKHRDKKELKRELEEKEKDKSGSKKAAITSTERESSSSKKSKHEQLPVNLDADEVLPESDSDDEGGGSRFKDLPKALKRNESDDEDESDEDDNDDDDDTEALMAELQRIKQERATEAARQEAERKAREEKIRVENILKGNPLLNNPSTSKGAAAADFKVRRRWDDDVVFKNCAKMDDDKDKKKQFINDSLRSEFHKKFMDRYIK